MAMALEGIRVVHLTRTFPASFCSMYLADMGAEVIKVEEPGYLTKKAVGEGAVYHKLLETIDRNKKSIQINLKDDAGREALRKLVTTADVFLEGLRPGVTTRLGIGYEDLRKINPRLIYASLSGYGQDGPYAQIPGHDLNYTGISGVVDATGPKDGPPRFPGIPIADLGGAMHVTLGITTALLARERTGEGQHVDAAMSDVMVSWMVMSFANWLGTGRAYARGEDWVTGGAPYYNVYQCGDGKYLSLGGTETWLWGNFCKAIGRPELIEQQFATGADRERIFGILNDVFKQKSRDEWVAILQAADACIAPIHSLEESFENEHIKYRELYVDQQIDGRTQKTLGQFMKLSGTPGTIRTPAPKPGQHTSDLLTELGYGQDEIAKLRDAGAVA